MLVGQVISWLIALPILTTMQPATASEALGAHTIAIWRTQVRFLGAGVIAIAAIYTLARLARPVVGGLASTLAASRATSTADDTDQVPDASRITPQPAPAGTRAGHDISLSVALDAGVPLDSVSSTSHEIAVERPSAQSAVVSLKDSATIPNKPARLATARC